MGLFWDSAEEKEAKRKAAELEEKREKARIAEELAKFQSKSVDERFAIIFQEIKSLHEKDKEHDREISNASTMAVVGIVT